MTTHLDVDLMLPDLLLWPSRELASIDKMTHLGDIGEEGLSGYVEAQAFSARRSC